jgi:uncharacterized protein (DUF697 family)
MLLSKAIPCAAHIVSSRVPLLQAAAPLQMLINDQVVKQSGQLKSFAGGLVSQVAGLFGGGNQNTDNADTTLAAANPLTGSATTAPTAAASVSSLPILLDES